MKNLKWKGHAAWGRTLKEGVGWVGQSRKGHGRRRKGREGTQHGCKHRKKVYGRMGRARSRRVQRKSERGEGHAAWADGGRTWLGGGRIKKVNG
jgi:hypothetical protein